MDKKVIFAVAGSGKTTFLLNELNLDDRFLLVTYTTNNVKNLKLGIIKRFGYFPENIKLLSYFSFLYSFCYKPFMHCIFKEKGITYKRKPNRFTKKTDPEHYIDANGYLYSARISKLLLEFKVYEDIQKRITKYFDHFFVDEVQDLAGNDFNLLKELVKSDVEFALVGDFYQHTFDTSRDGSVNANLHEEYEKYIKEFRKMGLTIDNQSLSKSYRCSPTTCNFIAENLGIKIDSHRSNQTVLQFLDTPDLVEKLIKDPKIVKLLYQESHKYNYNSVNWGAAKGEDRYLDVCIVLNKETLKKYKGRQLIELPPSTRNKLYVALSRARNNVYLVPYNLVTKNDVL